MITKTLSERERDLDRPQPGQIVTVIKTTLPDLYHGVVLDIDDRSVTIMLRSGARHTWCLDEIKEIKVHPTGSAARQYLDQCFQERQDGKRDENPSDSQI